MFWLLLGTALKFIFLLLQINASLCFSIVTKSVVTAWYTVLHFPIHKQPTSANYWSIVCCPEIKNFHRPNRAQLWFVSKMSIFPLFLACWTYRTLLRTSSTWTGSIKVPPGYWVYCWSANCQCNSVLYTCTSNWLQEGIILPNHHQSAYYISLSGV